MSPLPKHLRPRWRYLAVAVETWPDADLDRATLQEAIWRAARGLLGDPGSADADLTVLRFSTGDGTGRSDEGTGTGNETGDGDGARSGDGTPGDGPTGGAGTAEAVVRVRHGEVERARAALACVARVDGHPVGLRVRGASGTVRACEEKYLGRATEHSEETTVAFEGADRPAVRRDGRVDVQADGAFVGAADLDLE